MRIWDIRRLVESTADSAFAVDCSGLVVAWNRAAEELFGRGAGDVVGKPCGQILQGIDECGPVCSRDCTTQQSVRKRHPVRNFDLQVKTAKGYQWCNLSVLIIDEAPPPAPYSIHIVHSIDTGKRLELVFRDFTKSHSKLAGGFENGSPTPTRSPVLETTLTKRELEILRFLAKGGTTSRIAAQLHISPTTVNNHVQNILRKLNAHKRLGAIRRAEYAGLV